MLITDHLHALLSLIQKGLKGTGYFSPVAITCSGVIDAAGSLMACAAEIGRHVSIKTVEDVDRYIDAIRKCAADAQAWIAAQSGDPLDLLRRIKFDMIGFHPVVPRM